MAEDGLSALQIIQHYYGPDTELVENAKTAENIPSYPGIPLKQGDFNEDVRRMQIDLNRISNNYPAIPKIPQTDGAFGKSTTDAVTAFQKIFNLTPDGIIGKATWYKIISIYNAVKKLGELEAEGIKLFEIPNRISRVLKRGSTGGDVLAMQYFLAFIADFDDRIPSVAIDGIFGPGTEAAVKAFQQSRGLVADGIVGRETWRAGYDAYKGIIDYIAKDIDVEALVPYPGVVLKRGMTGPSVKTLQEQLSFISRFIYQIPSISADGNFGAKTQAAVIDFQEIANLPVTGEVDKATWDKLAEIYINIKLGNIKRQGQFPGYIIEQR
ncbi:MAG: peptidoglycan-binding protein [Angelakisella sp.]|nr:peptidoglycan-binding protein [Angelakisella sp.]